jgi:hypothetical protein
MLRHLTMDHLPMVTYRWSLIVGHLDGQSRLVKGTLPLDESRRGVPPARPATRAAANPKALSATTRWSLAHL